MKTIQLAQASTQLLNHSGYETMAAIDQKRDLIGHSTVVRPVYVGQSTVSYLIAPQHETLPPNNDQLVALRDAIYTGFDATELQALCFDLSIPYEDVSGSTHQEKVQNLVQYAGRRGRLVDLAAYGAQKRPHLAWPTLPDNLSSAYVVKPDLAIVVSLARPSLADAAAYLDDENIDANLLLLTNVPAYDQTKFLPVSENWEEITQSFDRTLQYVQRSFPGVRRHFFFSAPSALTFLLGCVWGTVYQGDKVYHWHQDRDRGRDYYVLVGTVTRHLR